MKTKLKISLAISVLLLGFISCKKQNDFLNVKPTQSLATISTLSDCQSLLAYEQLFNTNDPALGESTTDDFYVTTSVWNSLSLTEQNLMIFAKQIYPAGVDDEDWDAPYQQIYYANTVLDALPNIAIASSQQIQYNQIKGSAFFYRAIAFYNLVQTFALPYDAATAGTELGIPLRLSSDLNIKATRSSEQVCYNQIIQDLQNSLTMLPVTPTIPTQPSQTAVNGLLARVYLALGDYNNAYKYSNSCLSQNKQLVDYNTITPTTHSLIKKGFFTEDIFHSTLYPLDEVFPNFRSITDSTLYRSYVSNDLRSSLFFIIKNKLPYFRGTYDNQSGPFSGIATDEMYLTRAECNARLGNTSSAMADLNTLLITRWKTGTFVPYTAVSPDDALQQILTERRKELLYRGLRWTDLRRLNKDTRFAKTLTTFINGITYTLPPNDPRYALPIPDNEITSSGIQQNQR